MEGLEVQPGEEQQEQARELLLAQAVSGGEG